MLKKLSLVAAIVAALAVSGCTTTRGRNVTQGAILGGLLGAGVGYLIAGPAGPLVVGTTVIGTTTAAVTGAAIGAGGGALIGATVR